MTITSCARTGLPTTELAKLSARFGKQLQTGEAIRAQHGASEAHFSSMLPDAVVFSRSVDDVVDAINLCRAAKMPITPYGAGTSIEGNALPIRGGVSLDLSGMNRILAVNAEDFSKSSRLLAAPICLIEGYLTEGPSWQRRYLSNT